MNDATAQPLTEVEQIEVDLLLQAIATKYGHDLRGYRADSLKRRLRNALSKSGADSFGDLQHRLLHDAHVFTNVLDDLTVQVSEMFRDPTFYGSFRERVVPILRTYPQLRIWHAGCSSGEEVYATAIILQEEGLYDRSLIYATDLSPVALRRAQEGVYPAERLATYASNYEVSGGRRSFDHYYSLGYDHIAFSASLRRNVVFFDHDLVGDHVFGEMHAVFCRNVLIYFGRELRLNVLAKLATGICRGGFLLLGSAEQLSRNEERLGFVDFDPLQRIYRHRGNL